MTTIPKISLRALEPEDLDLLYRIENDDALWRVGTTNVPYSRYVLRDYIANSSSDIYADRQLRLMIEDDNHQVVGIIDLVNFDPRHLRAEIGIVIEESSRRQGYATAAIREICRYADQILHLHQLYAIIDADNHAAINLFRKENFNIENTLRHWLSTGNEYHEAVLMQTFF